MSFHSELIAGVGSPLLLETAGQSIEVRLKSEDAPRTLTALIGKERTVEKQIGNTRKQVRQRRVTFTTDEASRFGGIAALPMNAIVTFENVDYAITEKPSDQDGMVSVILERSAIEDHAQPGYRRR